MVMVSCGMVMCVKKATKKNIPKRVLLPKNPRTEPIDAAAMYDGFERPRPIGSFALLGDDVGLLLVALISL